MSPGAEWVFGYGSLVSEVHPVRVRTVDVTPRWVNLNGARRSWNIAMRNGDAVNDAKHYVDPDSGHRLDIHVAFLNVVLGRAGVVNGLAIPVGEGGWPALDEREVNYGRVEVTDSIEPRLDGRVWCYVGRPDAESRFQRGMEDGDVFIAGEYADFVTAAFARGGADCSAQFSASTDPAQCPVRPLRLVRT